MRNTADLINEMKKEAKDAYLVAIAVGFSDETKFVFSSARDPLGDLNRLVKEGGSPIGLLRFEKKGDTVEGAYRPFSEYQKEKWAGNYLAGLLNNTAEIVALGRQKASLPDYKDIPLAS
jgi:hypothetical protein